MAGQGEEDARARLQRAAIALFAERGYDGATAAQIAARAGVTERTFFRHFADKREVLFDGERVLGAALTASIAEAPGELAALDVLLHAFRSVTPVLEANRAVAEPRHAVIAATPALRERELAKAAALVGVLAAALERRGVNPLRASLAAQAGFAAFAKATVSWLESPDPALGERLEAAFAELRAALAEGR